MSDFLPSLTASAQFAGDASGPLVFTAVPSAGMAATLLPFFKGDTGSAASVSADLNNRTKVGQDGGIFTPDIFIDPLAYYILAKA